MILVRFTDPSILGGRPWSPQASNVYSCPTLVPADAQSVRIKRYPDGEGDGPFEVELPGKLGLAHPRPRPAHGERVLVLIMSRDLLTLAVGTAVAPEAT